MQSNYTQTYHVTEDGYSEISFYIRVEPNTDMTKNFIAWDVEQGDEVEFTNVSYFIFTKANHANI